MARDRGGIAQALCTLRQQSATTRVTCDAAGSRSVKSHICMTDTGSARGLLELVLCGFVSDQVVTAIPPDPDVCRLANLVWLLFSRFKRPAQFVNNNSTYYGGGVAVSGGELT